VTYIGMDAHQQETQVCIEDAEGAVMLEQRIRTTRERFTALLGGRPRTRILLEAATESEWVAQHLETLGHEVIVADPNYAAMYATRSRRVKTDRRDARTLAAACRLGAYHPAHRTSAAQREVRAELAVREALVRTRTRYLSVIRALLRREGCRVPSGSAATFARRLATVPDALADPAGTDRAAGGAARAPHRRDRRGRRAGGGGWRPIRSPGGSPRRPGSVP
jgi:transposase